MIDELETKYNGAFIDVELPQLKSDATMFKWAVKIISLNYLDSRIWTSLPPLAEKMDLRVKGGLQSLGPKRSDTIKGK